MLVVVVRICVNGFLDFRHKITVQHEPIAEPVRLLKHSSASPDSPPASPGFSRLRAIACKFLLTLIMYLCL